MNKPPDTAIEVLEKRARQIGHGEINVKLIIHDGEIVGFDQIDPAIMKYRVSKKTVS